MIRLKMLNKCLLLAVTLLLAACYGLKDTYVEKYMFAFQPMRERYLMGNPSTSSTPYYEIHQQKLESNADNIESEIITFLNVKYPRKDKQKKKEILRELESFNLKLSPCKLADTGYKGHFLKYMPKSMGGEFKNPYWACIPEWPFFSAYDYSGNRILKERKVFGLTKKNQQFQFKYSSPSFPDKFNFPIDLITTQLLIAERSPSIRNTDYLVLDLPEALEVQVQYISKPIVTAYGSYDDNYFLDGFGWFPLNYRMLLLNAAFTPVYEENIRVIWNLYLFKIKYQLFNDTLNCTGLYLRPHPRAFEPRCDFSLQDTKLEKYLASAFDIDPMMYQSYFELILWQMYQPNDFEIKDSKGKERSFRFTSTNPKYPGMYEVKFDIYQPYEFKVKKR